MKLLIKCKGNKKDGYILSVDDGLSYQDIAIKYEEIEEIIKELNKIK